ncbi:hypothetical protein ABBQ38_005537 [Trebouxia sp. C0009 RCD-2024]
MAAFNGGHDGVLKSLLDRLEGVTSRLEGLQGASGGFAPATAAHTPSSAAAAANDGASATLSTSVADYTSLTGPAVSSLVEAARPLGAEVVKASELVSKAFQAQAGVVQAMAQCKKPTPNELPALVAPVAEHMQAATALIEGRRSAIFNHQKAVAESLHALSWMVYTGPNCGVSLPAQHVEESWQSAEFFANKVMMEFRNSDSRHVDWVKALKQVFQQLKSYVKQHHAAGPAWNGIPFKDFKPDSPGAAAPSPVPASAPKPQPAAGPSRGGPAAPPPPPPGTLLQPKAPAGSTSSAAGASSSSMSAVFSQLNKGGTVTSGLKKVTDDMKTKNRADRSGAVPSSAPSATKSSTSAAGKAAVPTSAPPRTELVLGRKWCVENHTGNRSLTIDQTDAKQSVYIFNCSNCTVQVQGKVNAITLDSCSRTGLVFQDLVSSCEVVNCSSVEVQSTGVMPTIAIDKTDGIVLYLSEASLGVAITTAKSSAMNVVVPGNGDSDPLELPVPEQFVSTFRDGKLVTEAVMHSGA